MVLKTLGTLGTLVAGEDTKNTKNTKNTKAGAKDDDINKVRSATAKPKSVYPQPTRSLAGNASGNIAGSVCVPFV